VRLILQDYTSTQHLLFLQSLHQSKLPHGLCLQHRELAIQIAEQFEALGSVIRARSVVIVGGVDVMEQSIALAKKVQPFKLHTRT
jgi:ATP-dependent RNA helicase DDX47/RRP3